MTHEQTIDMSPDQGLLKCHHLQSTPHCYQRSPADQVNDLKSVLSFITGVSDDTWNRGFVMAQHQNVLAEAEVH